VATPFPHMWRPHFSHLSEIEFFFFPAPLPRLAPRAYPVSPYVATPFLPHVRNRILFFPAPLPRLAPRALEAAERSGARRPAPGPQGPLREARRHNVRIPTARREDEGPTQMTKMTNLSLSLTRTRGGMRVHALSLAPLGGAFFFGRRLSPVGLCPRRCVSFEKSMHAHCLF